MPTSELRPPKLLLVEGLDDKHVVEHLCREVAHDLTFVCKETRGSDPLLKAISVETKLDGRRALGIVMDANDDLAARWQAIDHRLRGADVQLPDQPAHGGTVIDNDPRVGVWLMPDNSGPGELENFVAELVPKDDPVGLLPSSTLMASPASIDGSRQGRYCGQNCTLGWRPAKSHG